MISCVVFFGIGISFKRFLFQHATGKVARGNDGSLCSEVDADRHCVGGAERKQDWWPPAGRFATNFFDQSIDAQLLDDQGNCRTLQSSFMRDLSARNRASFSHVIQNDLAIDIANRV